MLPNYIHLSAAGNASAGGTGSHTFLVAVNVNTAAAASTVTIQDAAGTVTIAVIDSTAKGSYWFGGVRIPGGIKVTVAGGNPDVTVSYI